MSKKYCGPQPLWGSPAHSAQLRQARLGKPSGNSKPVIVDGVRFASGHAAAKSLGKSKNWITRQLKAGVARYADREATPSAPRLAERDHAAGECDQNVIT